MCVCMVGCLMWVCRYGCLTCVCTYGFTHFCLWRVRRFVSLSLSCKYACMVSLASVNLCASGVCDVPMVAWFHALVSLSVGAHVHIAQEKATHTCMSCARRRWRRTCRTNHTAIDSCMFAHSRTHTHTHTHWRSPRLQL